MAGYCFACSNTGYRNCYCGGDLCVCDNYGEFECTACDGAGPEDDYDDIYDGYEYGPDDAATSTKSEP